MHISIPSILVSLGVKCLLNWVMVVSQKKGNVCRGFMGVFGVSLALVDTVLTLSLTALHFQADGVLLGVRLTRHHVCLLSQLAGQIYGVLQWPVVVLGFLDCYVTLSGQGTSTTTTPITARLHRAAPVPASTLLWCSALIYLFLLSDFYPPLGEEHPYQLHRCWVFLSSQVLHVGTVIVLAVACVLAYLHKEHRRTVRNFKPRLPSPGEPLTERDRGALSRRDVVQQALTTLLDTWTWFLVGLAALLLLLPVGIPGYLSLNVPWLCFLNSVLTAVVLSASCPASRLTRGLAAFPLDSFCDWRLGCGTGTNGT
ncbi:probable G-protein coupled receptor 160 [Gadus chalcogrammus]|uniref:probable G-protein coupled receptor 160 n=1 Tax=Gadus chalcogrammus TaxID=1042646 RepID=UPI0024C47E7B|nr:probable G-protein coupled receptor 160 [Gadus chalcogrammus]XP_056453646.1 probable G-protein coupled receptor 160 [Gadus chalcogrammus]XP_056453647.1 probable G-protein coupled receptor 160 [Gadus chalcogrammus]